MREIRVYQAQLAAVGECVSLTTAAQHHVLRVLRLRVGDELVLFDGLGKEVLGQITSSAKNACEVKIMAQLDNTRESNLHLILCLALLKGDAMDRAIQKAVELGVCEIYPFVSEFSEVTLKGERILRKVQHWQGIIEASATQCGRAYLPVLHSVQTSERIWQCEADIKWLAHPHAQTPTAGVVDAPKRLAVAIGAEGGFSAQEVVDALAQGWQAQIWGKRIMRADTAVIAALTLAQAQYGDFG